MKDSSSVQQLVLDEETTGSVIGYRTSYLKIALFIFATLASGGTLLLFFYWLPSWRAFFVGRPCSLEVATWVLVLLPLHSVRAGNKDGHSGYSSTFTKVNIIASKGHKDRPYRTFLFRHLRYIFNFEKGLFVESREILDVLDDWSQEGSVPQYTSGLTDEQVDQRRAVYDMNIIDIGHQNNFKLFFEHIVHPFYVFQVFSVLVWYNQLYYWFATCIVIISFFSLGLSLYDTIRNYKRLREMATYTCQVTALRNGQWVPLKSDQLVPGDIINVTEDMSVLPCDGILLTGICLFDESMLTGESIPVSKVPFAIEPGKDLNASLKLKKHILYSGTKIIRTKVDPQGHTRALVSSTGFYTAKGLLVRSILFPKPNDFTFFRDSFLFITILCVIALIGFFYSLSNVISNAAVDGAGSAVLKFCEVITIAIPPSLPAAMTIGSVITITRLKTKKIFCISPPKINVAGKLNLICFDKTGTLTEDGLSVHGVSLPAEKGFESLLMTVEEIVNVSSANSKAPSLLNSLATVHYIRLVKNRLIGDPIDLSMFEFTQFTLEEVDISAETEKHGLTEAVDVCKRDPSREKTHHLRILRAFEFDPALQRMSVLVLNMKTDELEVHVKGAPEVIAQLCNPSSIPQNFASQLSIFTRKGFRVLGIASKRVSKESCPKAGNYTRAESETDLIFTGLLILENPLKNETAGAIKNLHGAGYKTVMITGDNILTAVNVGKKCGLIKAADATYIYDGTGQNNGQDDELVRLETQQLGFLGSSWRLIVEAEGQASSSAPNFQLAMTGKDFLALKKTSEPAELKKILLHTTVFARMTPELKKGLVEEFMALDFSVGMCGDGANDCGSLRAADVGLSLADTEASVAAPFSAGEKNIQSMVNLLRHGRCALTTSLVAFKFMALYGMIQATTVVILYNMGNSLGDYQFLWQDLFLVLPFGAAMAYMRPKKYLSDNKPISNLISKPVIFSLFGHVFLQALSQGLMYGLLPKQSFFIPYDEYNLEGGYEGYENSTLFLVSAFSYVSCAFAFSLEQKFQRPFFKNPWFTALLVYGYGFSLYMCFATHEWIIIVMNLVPDIPLYWRGIIVAFGFGHMIAALLFELFAVPGLCHLMVLIEEAIRGGRRLSRHHERLMEDIEKPILKDGDIQLKMIDQTSNGSTSVGN